MKKISETSPAESTHTTLKMHCSSTLQQNYVKNDDMAPYLNPIGRQKCKSDQRKFSLLSRSQVNQAKMHSRDEEEHSELKNGAIDNSRCQTHETEWTPGLAEQVRDLAQRVTTNEREIQRLKQIQARESPTLKLERDFREIKDIYWLIKDQKIAHAELAKNTSEELGKIKNVLGLCREQIEKRFEKQRVFDLKLEDFGASLKQMHANVSQITQKLDSEKGQANFALSIKQILEQVQNLKTSSTSIIDRLAWLQKKQTQSSFLSLRTQLTKSKNSCQGEPLEVLVTQTVKSGQEPGLKLSQFVYYIDKQGYLLDENKFYLLNDKNEMIQILQENLVALGLRCQVLDERQSIAKKQSLIIRA